MRRKSLEILVEAGPIAGRRFPAPADGGARLGRASSCEISIPDPALSRNHCLFELREEAIWVTDLASANGTMVNGEPLGASSRKLELGDTVSAGGTTLRVVDDSAPATPAGDAGPALPTVTDLDLGLGKHEGEERADGHAEGKGLGRGLLWGVAAAASLVLSVFILIAPAPEKSAKDHDTGFTSSAAAAKDTRLISVSFERVDATTTGIYRYAMDYFADGSLHVEYADVPQENRHLSRTVKLGDDARKRLSDIFSGDSLYTLEPEYFGSGVSAGIHRSRRLKVVRGGRVFETTVENTEPPNALRTVCERLEAFAKSELGAWALQYSTEKLREMSAEAERSGDAKWSERDVEYGNLAEAIMKYDEAIVDLDTVNPKPAGYEKLLEKLKSAKEELDRRYRDQRYLVDKAENMKDWNTAMRELRVLCDMVPDGRDPRHAEANAKLINVENRMKQQRKKGASK